MQGFDSSSLAKVERKYSAPQDRAAGTASLSLTPRGLCSLLTSSKLPHTKAVQNWVLNSVLPTIRQMGGYITHSIAEDVEPIRTDTRRVHADALSSSSSSSSAPVDLHQKLENITKDLLEDLREVKRELERELYQRTQNTVTRERSLKRQRAV